MPFFLLSRDDNDVLRLLTPVASPSRQEALAVLSKMTAEPDFDAWNDDVLLVDIDSALPVLLVRPADSGVSTESDTDVVVVGGEDSEVEPLPEVTSVWPVVAAAEPDDVSPPPDDSFPPIPAEEAEAFASYVSLADEEGVAPDADDAESPEVAPSDDPYPLPALAMELEGEAEPVPDLDTYEISRPIIADEAVALVEAPEPVGEPPHEEELPPSEPEEGSDLREALVRTAAVMEAETAAADIFEPTGPEPAPEPPAPKGWPWDVAPPAAIESVVEPLGVAEEPGAAVEAATALPSDFLMDLEPILPAAGLDEDGVVEAPLTTEPLQLMEPADEPSEAEPVSEPEVAPAPESEAELEPEPEAEHEAALETAPAPEPNAAPEPESPVEPKGIDEYVCADCVYVDTCPNKDQRLPKECGSFQWK